MRLDALRNWYERQSSRDQLVLRWGVVAAVLILLVAVLLPLQRSVTQARRQVAAKQADLQWMRSMGPALAAAGPGPATAPTGQSLVVLIDSSARESGLGQALTSSQPAGGAVRIQLESADFNLLVGWLSRLTTQHGVRVESASVTGSAAPGIVNASVVLRAP